jgi:hypothetical protein
MSEPGHDSVEQPVQGEVRHLPVPSEVVEARPVEPSPVQQLQRFVSQLPAPAVAAAGGFLMGVISWISFRVFRGRRRTVVRGRRGRRGVEVAASRSFLVDVHLLKDR